MADEQVDAVNRVLREGGVLPPEPPSNAPEGSGRESDPPKNVPKLELPRPGWNVTDFARSAGAIVKTNGMYRRDWCPVTIRREDSGNYTMVLMTADRFRTYMDDLAMVGKRKMVRDEEGKIMKDDEGNPVSKMIKETMGKEVATGTLASDAFLKQQRELVKINAVRMPVQRADGRIELLPLGFDAEARVATSPNDVVIDESWTLDAAKKFLLDKLKEFPFKHDRDRAVHIAGMLALFGSGLQDANEPRLNFVYDANSQGAGKGLLVSLCVIPTMGLCETMTIPDQESEFRKILDMTALSASSYLFFDEVENALRNKTLTAFMTADYWMGRKFNTQAKFTAPKVTICYMAGNNIALTNDLARRSLVCSLFVEEADVQERDISEVMTSKLLSGSAMRGDFLSALWALIRHWQLKGRPKSSMVKRGFESWCHIFGGIVECAGLGNPLEPPPADESLDQEGDDMKLLVRELAKELGATTDGTAEEWYREYEFSDLIECCRANNCFTWKIQGKERKEKIGDRLEVTFELSPSSNSQMGNLFARKFGGKTFNLGAGRRAQFGERGRNRTRKYGVKLLRPGEVVKR